MRNTNYYDLKVIEGTDIFNPLAVDPDNLDLIDEVMHENASASISTATELTSGTVHSLVRDNADASVFRFVATSNATAGDTYTVDGIQVTALKPNGTPLADNDYVINANVLCILVGTLLTIYVSGTTATASDSEKLGGELPSYYGKAADVTLALENSSSAQTLANAVSVEVEKLKRVKLWENPDHTSAFIGQTVELNDSMTNYVAFQVNAITTIGSDQVYSTGIIPKDKSAVLNAAVSVNIIRPVSVNGSNAIIGNTGRYNTYGGGQTIANDYLIPVAIYGYKAV